MIVYNLLLALLSPLWALALCLRARTREGLLERLRPLAVSPPGTVWIHAASVGEIEAIGSVIAELRQRGVPLVLTAMTQTGRARAEQRFSGLAARLAPLDLRPLVRASLRRARVAVLVLVETELWPNYLDVAAGERVPCLIVGGRISDRSWGRYRRLRWLLRGPLRKVSRILARTRIDADRFVALGAAVPRTSVLGELKLDGSIATAPAELRQALGPGPFWVAGSTHPEEEERLLDAWEELRRRAAPGLRLVLVPRHPERAARIAAAAVLRPGVTAALRSGAARAADVIVVDTMGELAALYTIADLVFVGGSLVPIGGHNLLEPIRAGRAVLCGPHLENQRSQTELLQGYGVLHAVADAAELVERAWALWLEPDRHARARAACAELLAKGGPGREVLACIEAARGQARRNAVGLD